jgi:hypothetical protein
LETSGAMDLIRTILSSSFTQLAIFGSRPQSLPYGILCDFLWWLHPNDIFFLTFIVSKLWMLIFFSNQACLELVRAIYYSLQKDFSNSVFHAQIGAHLTFAI